MERWAGFTLAPARERREDYTRVSMPGVVLVMEVTAFAAHPSAHLLLTMHCDQYCLMVLLTLWKLHRGG